MIKIKKRRMKMSNQIRCFSIVVILFLVSGFHFPAAFAENETAKPKVGTLTKLECEVMEVEELKEPKGGAVYTVKDLSSGSTLRLFADPYRSLIQIGGIKKQAGDVLGGSKVTIIYQKSPDRDIPEIVFAKVTSSYYS